VGNRFLVLLATLFLAVAGVLSLRSTPIDALPDLSDVQVIIRTSYPGQAPQIVENQVTYPLATTMLSVPGAKTVRGYSFFGDSFVYVLFDDRTDLYWRPAWAGCSSTHWSTGPDVTTWRSCGRCRTGSSSSS
jgi:Cu(I)/Ag(I) efflux system membrane protein CusA/SilA